MSEKFRKPYEVDNISTRTGLMACVIEGSYFRIERARVTLVFVFEYYFSF